SISSHVLILHEPRMEATSRESQCDNQGGTRPPGAFAMLALPPDSSAPLAIIWHRLRRIRSTHDTFTQFGLRLEVSRTSKQNCPDIAYRTCVKSTSSGGLL